jgi:hypothetical protein
MELSMGLFSSCGQREGAQRKVREERVIAGLVGSWGGGWGWGVQYILKELARIGSGAVAAFVRQLAKESTGLLAALEKLGQKSCITAIHQRLESVILDILGSSLPSGRNL